MLRRTHLQAISIYAEALTEAGKKIDAIDDCDDIGVVYAPVVCEGEVIGFLNREVDEDFDFLPTERSFPAFKVVDLGRRPSEEGAQP